MEDINPLQPFVQKLSDFATKLSGVTEDNLRIVEMIDDEATNIKETALKLIRLINSSIMGLQQSIRDAESSGISSDALREQVSKLEEILQELNKELTFNTEIGDIGKRVQSNLADIKEVLESQERALTEARVQETPSGGGRRKKSKQSKQSKRTHNHKKGSRKYSTIKKGHRLKQKKH